MDESAEERVNHFALKLSFFIHACSVQPVGKTDESPYSYAGDMHLSYTDDPLCVADIYSSHAVKVLYVFYTLYCSYDKIQRNRNYTIIQQQ